LTLTTLKCQCSPDLEVQVLSQEQTSSLTNPTPHFGKYRKSLTVGMPIAPSNTAALVIQNDYNGVYGEWRHKPVLATAWVYANLDQMRSPFLS